LAAPAALPAALLNLPYPLSTCLRCRDITPPSSPGAPGGSRSLGCHRASRRESDSRVLSGLALSIKVPEYAVAYTVLGERKFTPFSARILTTHADVVNQGLLAFICGWHREPRLAHRCIWPPSANQLMEGRDAPGRGGEQRLGPRLLRDEDVEMPLELGQQIVTSPNLGKCRGSAAVAAGAGR
jgi:hypothetical protein